MNISKSVIVVVCLFFVWVIMGLNRLAVVKNNELIQAQILTIVSPVKVQMLSFVYNKQSYKYLLLDNKIFKDISDQSDIQTEMYFSASNKQSKKNVIIIIKHNNPQNYIILNFTDFWLPAIIITLFCSLIVLLYFQVFHSKTKTFKLFFKRPLSDNKPTI